MSQPTNHHHDHFVSTTHGLDRNSPPMRLFEKAKRYGIWNPSEIDFSQDKADWVRLNSEEQRVILHLTSLFQGGEEAVTLDLLPLMLAVAREGRIEEEMFLTTFLWEEAKHTDFFSRFLTEVTQTHGGLGHFHTAPYQALFYQTLPSALGRLMHDTSPEAQVIASVTYNMIVEGVLAETGYQAYFTMLKNNGLMPGQCHGIGLLKQDESRHIAYGIYLISRLINAHPHLWEVADQTMNQQMFMATGVIQDIFSHYDPVPFGLKIDDFMDYAMSQFQKRYARIQAAQGQTLDQLQADANAVIERDDA
jgi:ribonucleoside-diphosphate reductase beta chain